MDPRRTERPDQPSPSLQQRCADGLADPALLRIVRGPMSGLPALRASLAGEGVTVMEGNR